MWKGKNEIFARLSWKSIIAAIIAVLGIYFGVPEYIFSTRLNLIDNLGSDTVCFIEGAISGAVTVLLVLKYYSGKTSQQPDEGKKKTS